MTPIVFIVLLFVTGTIIGLTIPCIWRHYTPNPTHKVIPMSRKQKAVVKKIKPNNNRPPARPIVHLDILRVYHEVLKFEEVADIELDTIFAKTISVIESKLDEVKLTDKPDEDFLDDLIFEIVDQLKDQSEKKAA
jgi:hypothetical protein